MKKAAGFTLIELMITVAIVAILSAVAIPAYTKYVIRGKLVDATTQLSTGRVQIEQFFQDNRTYIGGPCPADTKYFSFVCTRADATYTLSASNIANQGLGGTGDYIFTIDQNNAKVTTEFAGNPVGASCWLMKEGDSC